MSISKLLPSGEVNDFNISITGSYVSVTFAKEYTVGSYVITSLLNDTTYDIYAFNSDGSSAGYTNSGTLTVSKGFNKIVVLGATQGDSLSFTFKTTYVSSDESNVPTAGPVATSVSPSAVPNVNDTFTLTGRNFASGATVTFTSANPAYTATAAKAVSYVNATSLTVTRPDNLIIAYSPYTLTVTNPGVTNPTGSNSNILSNAVTAGASPVWVTATTLPVYTKNVAYTTTVQATDPDAGGSITYSQVSSALPTGITFTANNATISGTASVTDAGTITIRATDTGGNFTDRTFTLPNVGAAVPTWVTPAGPLAVGETDVAYSVQLSATDDSGAAPTYSLQSGTLPAGLSISSSGLISGTPTAGNGNTNFTIRATDANGGTADRTFSIGIAINLVVTSTTSLTFASTTLFSELLLVGGGAGGGATAGYGGGGSGGGGGGECLYQTNVNFPAGTYTFTIGGGGTATDSSNTRAGGETSVNNIYARGGNGGARSGNDGAQAQYYSPAITGGGSGSYGNGWGSPNNQGSPTYNGGHVQNSQYGGGGGGSRGTAPDAKGGIGLSQVIGGVTYAVGGGGNGGNSAGDTSYDLLGGFPFGGGKHNTVSGQPGYDGTTNRGGGGGGRNAAGGQQIGSNGGSGIIVGRYLG